MGNNRAGLFQLLPKAVTELGKNDPLRLAGATAFFTTFSLPAILLIILEVVQLFLSPGESDRELFQKINGIVGSGAANHLFNVLKNFEKFADSPVAVAIGFVFLLFVATTLFKVIKNSLNEIWDIKVVERKSLILTLKMRSRELAVILSAGILFLVSFFLEGLKSTANEEFLNSDGITRFVLGNFTSVLISVIVATVWFGLIFSFLPDARIPIRTCLVGAFVTSVLFTTGKIILRWLLLDSNLQDMFGKSASVVLLLLFVFYSSFIFYLGAAFTKVLALEKNLQITPLTHASHYEVKETDPVESPEQKKSTS